MAKERKNSAVEQMMDELNKELQSSLDLSPDFFVSDLLEENHSAAKEEDLILFDPHKAEKKAQSEQPQNQSNSSEADPNIPLFKKKEKEEKSKKVEKTKENPADKKSSKEINFKAKSVPDIKTKKINQRLSELQNLDNSQLDVAAKNNIPMRITLQQSENLRVAQERIVALEMEIERLRTENEELIATGDIFRERLDKVIIQNDNLKKTHEESRQEFQDEKRTLMDTLNSQTREIEKISIKNKELEKRLSSNIQQIRVRERELENRLELMKLDNQTLAREKDQYILDLKSQIDRLKIDLESQKNKNNETSQKLETYQNQNRRVTRGLQMILHIARGSDTSHYQESEDKEAE